MCPAASTANELLAVRSRPRLLFQARQLDQAALQQPTSRLDSGTVSGTHFDSSNDPSAKSMFDAPNLPLSGSQPAPSAQSEQPVYSDEPYGASTSNLASSTSTIRPRRMHKRCLLLRPQCRPGEAGHHAQDGSITADRTLQTADSWILPIPTGNRAPLPTFLAQRALACQSCRDGTS